MNVHPLLQKLIPILYEDEQLLAIGKPAGVDVGGGCPIALAVGESNRLNATDSNPPGLKPWATRP